MKIKLQPPWAYQGGKQRIAKQIVDILFEQNEINNETKFYDLCCGSGAITIELISRGIKPENITMLDNSVWSLLYESIGKGEFDISLFTKYINSIPNDRDKIQEHLKSLYKQNAKSDTIYKFLLLQSGSFGSKAIWLKNEEEWCTSGFRNYWKPTETSSRRSPVNPMMPMPETLLDRVKLINEKLKGVTAIHDDIRNFSDFADDNYIIYIDPPYKNTSGYGYDFNVIEYIEQINKKVYISEGYNMFGNGIQITGSRSKGGISGERKTKNEEWLNIYNT